MPLQVYNTYFLFFNVLELRIPRSFLLKFACWFSFYISFYSIRHYNTPSDFGSCDGLLTEMFLVFT